MSKARTKWLAQPVLSLTLLLTWLLLVDDYSSAGHWLFGALLAVLIPRFTHSWWKPLAPVKRWDLMLVFLWRVLVDIIAGNIQVAKMVLGNSSKLQPLFVEYDTVLKNKMAVFMMMSAISLAPGSVSTKYEKKRRKLQVHVLHSLSEQEVKQEIRQRYEQILQRIFSC